MPQHFYTPKDVAKATARSVPNVYRYYRDLRRRSDSELKPAQWPLDEAEAKRLIEFINKRSPNKKATIN